MITIIFEDNEIKIDRDKAARYGLSVADIQDAMDKRGGLANIQSLEELRQAVIEGAVHRLRPKPLTEGVAIVAIAPMLFATGVASTQYLRERRVVTE